jgi:anaerobic dimethyl sulfoxide reductase subunit A
VVYGRARRQGPNHSIDPDTPTTATAGQWIPIFPSSDAAMAIAMVVIITENLHDQAFLDRYTIGFDNYKDYILGITD